jgi:hypothetical protein
MPGEAMDHRDTSNGSVPEGVFMSWLLFAQVARLEP